MRWFPFNIFRSEELVVSDEFINAVNKVLMADVVGDATRNKSYIFEDSALNLYMVWAWVRILSDTVGVLPIQLYERMPKSRERQYTHPCHRLLQLPNSFSNHLDLIPHLTNSCALWSNEYARNYRVISKIQMELERTVCCIV